MLGTFKKNLAEFNVIIDQIEDKLNSIDMVDYAKHLMDYERYCHGHVFHLQNAYFAMASLILKNVKNILEIGTGWGRSTSVLARLFPESTVYTIDVGKNDPCWHKSWRGRRNGRYLRRFEKHTALKNIKFIESNSMFLPELDLPDEFELIYVDGEHSYPLVAYDIISAYHRMKDGGYLFMDDYNADHKPGFEIYEVVEWMRERIKERIYLFQSVYFFPIPKDSRRINLARMVLIVKGKING